MLESLNQSIKEKILLKEWINVINLCDEVIELTNDLSSKIFNSSHPILLAYNIYAQALKRETLERNRRHLFILSTSFDECQTLESEKIGSAKIDVKLVNASSPDTVELTVQNLAGTFRFLNEDGVEINQIMLIPNVFSTIYLEYSFNENVDYGTHTIDLMFKELNYDTYYHKKIIINLVEDGDTTPPVITIDYLKGAGIPVLIIHSSEDDYIPFSHAIKLYNAANEPRQFLKISGKHNDNYIKSEEIYIKGIRSFISRY